jgi:alginate O-acetyltransferase complex protein AlgI
MAVSTAVDYLLGLRMAQRPASKKLCLVASIVWNVGILFVFKYFNFFQGNFLDLLKSVGLSASPLTLQVVLPVGISFYTFQKMTYAIDIYQGKLQPHRNFLDFALFVSFFPLLLSGPIERARNLLPQISAPRSMAGLRLREGCWLITWGLFKKIYIADNVAGIANPVFSPGWQGSGLEALGATYAYAVQIYCDFSGYSDIAQGLAMLLGFEVMRNFEFPYFAGNPSEFWRRWHISLSTWLRDYVYIPLGGGRSGEWRTSRNLLITMLLVGLWHGAAWTFVLWGGYHGCLLIAHRMMSRRGQRHDQKPGPMTMPHWLAVIGMFHLACFGWMIFRAESVQHVQTMLRAMVFQMVPTDSSVALLSSLLGFAALLVTVQLIQYARKTHDVLRDAPVAVHGLAYGVLFYLMVMHGGVSDSFIYFQF